MQDKSLCEQPNHSYVSDMYNILTQTQIRGCSRAIGPSTYFQIHFSLIVWSDYDRSSVG